MESFFESEVIAEARRS